MEFDDLKRIWNKQNSLIEKMTKINEKLLKNAFTQKANGVLDYWLKWEYFSLIEFVIFLLGMSVATYKFMDDWRFLCSGIFISLFLITCIIGSVISIRQLSNIHFFSQSLIEIKQKVLVYKKRSHQYQKILLFLIPPVIVTFLPLGTRFVRNVCLYDYPDLFFTVSAGIIILSYFIAFVSYKIIFSRKFRLIEDNLTELEKFREE